MMVLKSWFSKQLM